MDKHIGKLYCIKGHDGYANLLFKDDRMIICVYNYYTSYVVPLDKVRSDKIDLIIK